MKDQPVHKHIKNPPIHFEVSDISKVTLPASKKTGTANGQIPEDQKLH
jgi:hypothetical protein